MWEQMRVRQLPVVAYASSQSALQPEPSGDRWQNPVSLLQPESVTLANDVTRKGRGATSIPLVHQPIRAHSLHDEASVRRPAVCKAQCVRGIPSEQTNIELVVTSRGQDAHRQPPFLTPTGTTQDAANLATTLL
eukprot:CAMPEP_0194516004 /NCGR_PEP_ID=MMETSP0253-20130528/48781_1 /TAXON_ID=2966 /ORGANISM="Noctiluca scintillans" /LENGTH=133 /DNA_ID=CAMNT_0039359805 /DNA_START=11 /DNA_END=413 /DNA_ORIENTATION=-